MKILLTEDIFTERPELKAVLFKGNVLTIHIAEHQKGDHPKHGWYLVNTGVPTTGIFMSEPDIVRGNIVRTYRDPNLPNEYNVGPYQWINQGQGQVIHENNESAKHLLQKYEWRL